jgi:hypothetical protein
MNEPDPKEAKYNPAITSGTSTSGKTHDSADKLPPTFQPPAANPGDPHVPVLEVPIDQDPKEPNITFDKTRAQISAYCALLAAVGAESNSNSEHLGNNHKQLIKIPHPKSNFHHLDPEPKNDDELEQLPPPQRESFQRLQLAFDWLICRISPLLGDLNQAIKDDDVDKYISARNAYLEFANNLANRDPGPKDIDPINGFGYGGNCLQTSIVALIGPDETTGQNVIKGARIQAEWNPHLSSSGVPIKH